MFGGSGSHDEHVSRRMAAAHDDDDGGLIHARLRRARVAVEHMSDTGGPKGAAKWAVGATATARVLDLDPSARRCRATLKKTLVASKLPPLLRLEVRAAPRTPRGSIRMPWEPSSSSMIIALRYLWPCVPTARARA